MRIWIALLVAATTLAGCFGGDQKPDEVQPAEPEPAALSAVLYDTILVEGGYVASSIDGVPLRYDVWRPDAQEPVPVILVQSPYWSFLGDAKNSDRPTWYIDYFVPRGYAVVLGEMRGTRDSGGCWDFGGELDQQDGADMVEGLAAMPWSNGNVGMLGQSHVGMSQVAAAVKAPPSLKTIVPIAAVTDWYRYLHKDGAPYVLNRGTPPAYFVVHASPSTPDPNGEGAPVNWLLTQAQTTCVDNVIHLSQSAELDGDKDAYWQERDLIARAGDTRAAVFLVHGFLDENVKTDHFLDYWNALPDDIAKKAWFGQWFHEHPSYYEWREDLHRWFDLHLKGLQNGILDEPVVTVQDNLYINRTSSHWPQATDMVWTIAGDGLRAPGVDPGDEGQEGYVSQPADDRGPWDGEDLVGRPYLVKASNPLPAPIRIAGEVHVRFDGVVNVPQARWIAALFDVAPDGDRDEISRGYIDAAHREGNEVSQLPTPFIPLEYTLRMFPRDHTVQEGHRLELAFFGGDMGCQTNAGGTYGGTCEGTGVVPTADGQVLLIVTGGKDAQLRLPVAPLDQPERTLTPLENWLDDPPE